MKWFADKKVPECITDRVFMYYAIMDDGMFISEYEDDGKETIFTEIDKSKVRTLGLIGRGVEFHFDTEDGLITDHNNHKYNLYLPTNDPWLKSATKRPKFYGEERYNDIIQYKSFISDDLNSINNNTIQIFTNGYHIGWKRTISHEDITMHIKMILSIILSDGIKISVTASSNTPFIGGAMMARDDGLPCEVYLTENNQKSFSFEYTIP